MFINFDSVCHQYIMLIMGYNCKALMKLSDILSLLRGHYITVPLI